MYNKSLYPLARKQHWVSNMLIAHIPSSFKYIGRFNIHSIDACLRVN